jgi:curved DNA-binding protein CbpA
MNNFQLAALRKELIEQRKINIQQGAQYKQIIHNLLEKQNSIRTKIPETQFNKVNEFLEHMDRDISSQNTGIKKWQAGDPITQIQTQTQTQTQSYSRPPNPPNLSNNPLHNNITYAEKTKSQNEIDPYKLYGLERDKPFTLEKLKETYKRYALKTHPDMEGGNDRNFSIVTNAYKFLLEELKKMEKDKQYTQLKNDSIGYLETQQKSGKQNSQMSGNFNLNQFNQIYHDNRLEDPSNEGYNEWLKANKFDSEDIVKDTSITSGNFNSQFDSRVKVGQELQVYKMPHVLNSSTNSNIQELGVENVENYSGQTGQIRFTDLKEAHTTSRLVDPNAKYKKYNSIDQISAERSNMGDMSSKELKLIEENEYKVKVMENQREENQRRMDRMYTSHHDRMNNMFLGMGSR